MTERKERVVVGERHLLHPKNGPLMKWGIFSGEEGGRERRTETEIPVPSSLPKKKLSFSPPDDLAEKATIWEQEKGGERGVVRLSNSREVFLPTKF